MQWGARLGFAVSGVLHLLIAWIALKVAWSTSGGSANQSGALSTLARGPGGALLLQLRGTRVFSGGGAGREVGDGCDEQDGFGHDRYQAQWLAPVADVISDVWQTDSL